MSGPEVAVVGGGLAGISAALACADAGASVTVLEVRPRLGGAAYSFRRDDLWLDNGQHVFLRCCTAYRALLARLGSEGDTVLQRRLEIPVLSPGRETAWLRRTPGPAPLHLAPALLRYPHLTKRQRVGAIRAAVVLSRVRADDPALDQRTFAEWLAEHGQGPAAIAALWDLIALPTLNLRADEASAALGAFVFQEGLLRRADAGDVGWARAPLSAVHGEPAERALRDAGIEVRLRWRAQRVAAGRAGRLEVEATAGDGVDADAVIVAVPHQRAGALLPDGALPAPERLARLGASPIVNLHVVYDRRVTDLPFAAGVGTPVQYVFDRTRGAGLGDGQYVAVSLSGAAREMGMTGDELRARYVPALAELLPRARGARIERFVVTREHAATFRAAPGVGALRPGPRTDVRGLVLAGAWTDTGWPATMEGAVLSGHAAAREALASAGAREPAVVGAAG
jgi:squalene-associated FAD-dependent desaturase